MGRARNGTNSTVVDFALSTFAARDSTNLNMLAKCQTQRVLSTHEKFSFVNLCLDETVVCEDAILASWTVLSTRYFQRGGGRGHQLLI
jgi:predicted phage-related endonuclease